MKRNTKERIESQVETFGTAEEFRGYMRQKARQALYDLLEEEMEALCGESYHPDDESVCYRSGSAPSSVYIESRREELKRPRVRRKKGEGSEEVTLKAWQLARDPEEWEDTMMRAILCGASTRKVSQLRESELKGETKSHLSRLWQKKAADLVQVVQQRDLSQVNLLVMMLDAVVLCPDLVATVAMGIDTDGNKHILGYRIGSSENEEVCADLLSNLRARDSK